jgi:uncharacterized protein YbjT (DUF2867 family)
MMKVAVAGGTGLIGRMVVAELERTGHETVVLSRSRGVDLTTGKGLDEALSGADAIIDVSNVTTMSKKTSVAFFAAVTEHLLSAGARAGVGHVLALSIVGVDHVDFGYYLGKRRQEELLAAGPLPWTVLRATQFHEFAGQTLARVAGPLAVVPRMLVQPVAAREVAARLVALVDQKPAGFTAPIAGPEKHDLVGAARRVLQARHERRIVVPIRIPGRTGRALASGGLLPVGDYTRGRQTFAEYLAGLPSVGTPQTVPGQL